MSFEENVTLDNFIGQQSITESLKVTIAASKMRNEILGHMLFVGPRGSGKNTLINAIVNEINTTMRISSFNAIRNASDLAAILTNLESDSILVIENFDAIKQDCAELLCTAMEDCCMDIIIGKGPTARSVRLDLTPFILIGVMDVNSKVPDNLLSCFSACYYLSDYSTDELIQLSKKWCLFNKMEITADAAEKVAVYAEGSNRKLSNTLKRARDFASVINGGIIDYDIADKAIDSLVVEDMI